MCRLCPFHWCDKRNVCAEFVLNAVEGDKWQWQWRKQKRKEKTDIEKSIVKGTITKWWGKKYVSSPSNLRQQQLSNKDTNGIMFASCGESVKNRSVGMEKQRKKMFSFFLSPSFRHRLQLFVWCPFRSARELTLSDDGDNNERKRANEQRKNVWILNKCRKWNEGSSTTQTHWLQQCAVLSHRCACVNFGHNYNIFSPFLEEKKKMFSLS